LSRPSCWSDQFVEGNGNGELYFTCTDGGLGGIGASNRGAGQIWRYVPGQTAQQGGTIELFVEPNNANILAISVEE
jgi:secreted PhoX family phosphatase